MLPQDATTHAMLAVMDYRAHDCEAAVGHFQQAASVLRSQSGALLEYGECLAILHRYEEAMPELQQAVALAPDDPVARYNLALDAWDAHRTQDALQALAPVLSEQQPPSRVLILAADISESDGDTQAAIVALRKAILLYPKDEEAILAFAELSYKHSSFQVGIDMLNAGLRQMPKNADLYLYRGVLYCELGNTGKGLADFETADTLKPALSFAGVAEGIAESQAHDAGRALATFRLQAAQHPDDALAQYLFAEALSQQGAAKATKQYTEEVAAAKRAVKLKPGSLQARDLLANIYLDSGEVELAKQQCQAALAIDPNDQQALYHLILALRRTSDKAGIPSLVARLAQQRTRKRKHERSSRGFTYL